MAEAKTKKVKVTVIVSYFDKELEKEVRVGDAFNVSPARAKTLKEKGLVK